MKHKAGNSHFATSLRPFDSRNHWSIKPGKSVYAERPNFRLEMKNEAKGGVVNYSGNGLYIPSAGVVIDGVAIRMFTRR